jgi:hypothetical protein
VQQSQHFKNKRPKKNIDFSIGGYRSVLSGGYFAIDTSCLPI